MAVKKSRSKTKTPASLSRGRPPTAKKPPASLSAKATRTLIRSHHQLHKARARALADGNDALVADLDQQIESKGGLKSYQLASITGQSIDRGGDSSKILVEWLAPVLEWLDSGDRRLRVLEVGALSVKNACSMEKSLDVTRIDLNSQGEGILQQDFMERPLPSGDEERFHLISLSLVLNYVPDPVGRGEMLRRTTKFLVEHQAPDGVGAAYLFLVLPAACVLNSRYFTEERLKEIMLSLGYQLTKRKVSNKLIFHLWERSAIPKPATFRKEILNDGKSRNNFTVILNSP